MSRRLLVLLPGWFSFVVDGISGGCTDSNLYDFCCSSVIPDLPGQLESVRSEQGPVHPVTVQTSTRDRGRERHCGGHPQGPRGRVSALSFAAPGAEASDACNHQEPGPTGLPHRSRACLSTTSANTSCRASVLPSPLPSLRSAGCPGPRVRAGWVEPAPQPPTPPPGARQLHRAPYVPRVGPKERRGQRAAFSKLSGVWTTEDPPAPTPPPNGLGSRGGRGPALRPRLLFTPPLPLDLRPRRAAETRVGRHWGAAQRRAPLAPTAPEARKTSVGTRCL